MLAVLSLAQVALPLLISPALVRGDAVGYYAWLRSPVIDGDLNFENEFEYFREALPDSRLMSTLHLEGPRTATGLVANHWPAGAAVLWSPFFLAAHGVGSVFGLPDDGYAMHYQVAVCIGSVLYGLLGLIFLYHILRRFFPVEPSVLALLSVWGASSLTAYMYFMLASHTGSFFAVTLLILLWLKVRESANTQAFFWLGAVCGLATIVRLQDVLFAAILGVECVQVWRSSTERIRTVGLSVLAIFIGGVLVSLPQLIGWQVLYGHPFPTSYAPGTEFDWSAPYLMRVLFAPRYGLLSSTPVFLLALIGIPLLWRRDRLLVVTLGGVFLLQLWIVASFNFYGGGAAFSPRYFISTLPLVALALGALYWHLSSRFGPWPSRLLMAALVAWNYLLLALYGFEFIRRSGTMSWGGFFQGIVALVERLLG